MTADPHLIAARLTKAQREAVKRMPFWGVRPGSNLWPLLGAPDPEGYLLFGGEDVDFLARTGLAEMALKEPGVLVGTHPEMGEIWTDHKCSLTPLGRAVRDVIEGEGRE